MSKADIVNAWFNERMRGGALARDTDAYNQVVAAIPDLIARLDAADAPAPAAAAKPASAPSPPATPAPDPPTA
jgi:hypothetical protein